MFNPDHTYRLGIMLEANLQQMAERARRPYVFPHQRSPECGYEIDALALSNRSIRRQMQEA